MSYTDTRPVTGTLPASDTGTTTPPAYRRVLIPIQDAAQAEHAVELARRAGASEALVLHLNLRESYGGRRFALETDSAAGRVVEATVLELSMAGVKATGQVRPALIDRAADEILAEAADWGADLIVLGFPRRGTLTTRLFGSVTLSVLQQAPCPVLVASPSEQGSPAAR
jgi:nucleotide-binding universal stress UspA family protein